MRRSQAPSVRRQLLQLGHAAPPGPAPLPPSKAPAPSLPVAAAVAVPCGDATAPAVPPPSAAADSSAAARCFRVLWCAATRKKHKTYSDGVLVVAGGSAALYGDDGRQLARVPSAGLGAPAAALAPGAQLSLRGRDVEVDAEEPYAAFERGSLFASGHSDAVAPAHAPQPRRLSFPKLPAPPAAAAAPRQQEARAVVAEGAVVLGEGVAVDPWVAKHLREHQVQGVRFMYGCVARGRGGCVLADEMGLGKTLQAIALVWTLVKQGGRGGRPLVAKALVVCPNTLLANWRAEFRKWLGPERLDPLFLGDAAGKQQCEAVLRQFAIDTVHPVLVVSYEQLRMHAEALPAGLCGLVVCDEAHRVKNAASKTAEALRRLGAQRTVLLTGTPVQNDLDEFYAMLELCAPGLLGPLAAFRATYARPIARASDPAATPEARAIGEQRAAELARVTSQVVLRRLSTILAEYLPPKSELVVLCRPTGAQAAAYKQCLASKRVRQALQDSGGACALECMQRLVKVCSHPALLLQRHGKTGDGDDDDDEGGVGDADDEEDRELARLLRGCVPEGYDAGQAEDALPGLSGKMAVLDRLLAEVRQRTQDKVVLISAYTRTLDWFERLMRQRGHTYARLDGQTDTAKRAHAVEWFNGSSRDACFVFLLSAKAGGLGLNLVGANRLVLYEPDWNPAWDRQAMARVWRDGQAKPVWIYRLLTTGTIEEKVFQRQISKQSLSRNVVLDHFEGTRGFSRDDLRAVFSLNESTLCDTHDLIACERCGSGSGSGGTAAEERQTRGGAAAEQRRTSQAEECGVALAQCEHLADAADIPDPLLRAAAESTGAVSFTLYFKGGSGSSSSTTGEKPGEASATATETKQEEEPEQHSSSSGDNSNADRAEDARDHAEDEDAEEQSRESAGAEEPTHTRGPSRRNKRVIVDSDEEEGGSEGEKRETEPQSKRAKTPPESSGGSGAKPHITDPDALELSDLDM
eukprot:m51a1_g9894 putative dna repair and recombination protein rad54b (976) ;mRNA; f:50668-53875